MNPQTPECEEFTPKMGGRTPKRGGVNVLCCLIDSNPNLGPFQPQFGGFGGVLGVPSWVWGGRTPKPPNVRNSPQKWGGTPKPGGVNALCCLIDSSPNLGPFQPQFWDFLGLFGEFWGSPDGAERE